MDMNAPGTLSDKRVWTAFAGIATGLVVAVFTRNNSTFPLAAVIAGIVAGGVGWYGMGRYRIYQIVRLFTQEYGDVESFLDRTGREFLTVWIPLDHETTDDDRRSARQLGESVQHNISRDIVRFVSCLSDRRRVGVKVAGRDAEVMLEAIRPYFKQHCPKGSFVAILISGRATAKEKQLDEFPTTGFIA